MEKIWFIEISGKAEGPYSIYNLKHDSRITPDTLVWKEGFPKWLPVRKVPELNEIFKDEHELPERTKEKPIKKSKVDMPGKDELAINLQKDFPPIYFWWLLIALIVFYIFYRFNQS